MSKHNGKWKYLTAIVAITLAVIGFVYNRGIQAGAIEDNEKHVVTLEKTTAEDLATLKEDGCDPADEALDRCLVLETEFKHLNEGQKRIETKMDSQHTIVLKAIETIKEK